MDVLSDRIARLDAIRILSGLNRKKSNRITASCTVSRSNRKDAAVHVMAAASTSNVKGVRDCYA